MKILVQNYSFDKTSKQVTFTDYATIRLDSILLITNTTVSPHVIIYNFAPPASGGVVKGGTVATNVLTLEFDTSAMANTDKLQIYYDDANNDQGLKTDTAASTDTGTFSIYAFWKRLLGKFTTQLPAALGQTTKSGSLPVTIASDQGAGTLPTGAATEAKQDTLIAKDFATQTTLAAVLAKIITAPATEAKQDAEATLVGGVTETAPGTDTASSGLNGRLQRVAQRLTSLIALLPSSIGQKAKAGSLSVTLASDQDGLSVTFPSDTSNAGSLGSLNAVHVISPGGYNGIGCNISGTWVGTITPQVSFDNGTVYVNTQFIDPSTQTLLNSVTANGSYGIVLEGGVTRVQLKMTAYSSGTATTVLKATILSSNAVLLQGALPVGANAIGKLAANSGVIIGDVNVINSNVSQNVAQINGVAPLMGNGVTGTGSPRVTIANDNTDIPVKIQPETSGGLTVYHLVSAASTNATVVKSSAGQLYGWYIYNQGAGSRKVAFHNTASTPTAGSSIFFTLSIPSLSGANVFSEIGIPFSTGIAITTISGNADSDNSAVGNVDLNINLFYK